MLLKIILLLIPQEIDCQAPMPIFDICIKFLMSRRPDQLNIVLIDLESVTISKSICPFASPALWTDI